MKTFVSDALALSLSFAINAAQVERLSGTPRKVVGNGMITLGYRDASMPFPRLGDNSGQPMDYSVELVGKIVERLKSTLGKSKLKMKYNLVTSQTRTSLAQSDIVDLECGSIGVIAERQRQMAFSYGFIYVKGQLLIRKGSGTTHFDDLKGKNMVTATGTTSKRYLKNYNAEHKLGVSAASAEDYDGAPQMLQSSHVVAFYMNDALLYGERTRTCQPYDWMVVGEPQSRETYSCMVHKNDLQLLTLVSETLAGLYRSDKVQCIYQRQLQQPIPPKGLSLELPITTELKAIFKNPTSGLT